MRRRRPPGEGSSGDGSSGDGEGAVPTRAYRLTLALPLGTKRGIGRGGFNTSIHEAVDTFYRDVMQTLVPWTPPPPKLPAHDAAATEDQPEASDDATGTL